MVLIPFSRDGILPKEREDVIVRLEPQPEKGWPAAYVWGYLRYAAGDKSCPYFVTPGIGDGRPLKRKVTHWARMLKDGFFETVKKMERA